MTDATPRQEVRMSDLVGDGSEAAVAALVDEHHGAMSRFARLVGRDQPADDAVRRAWLAALARPDEQPEGTSVRGWLLALVIDELAPSPPPVDPPTIAPPADFEGAGRWSGWWKDELPATPEPDPELLERAVGSIPPSLAAMLVLRDVEGIGAVETALLTGQAPERQRVLLHHARAGVRTALRASREDRS